MITTGWLGIKLFSAGFRSTSGISATAELFEKSREDSGKDIVFLVEDTVKKSFPPTDYETLATRIGSMVRENGDGSVLTIVLSSDLLGTEMKVSGAGIRDYWIIDQAEYSLAVYGNQAPVFDRLQSTLESELVRMKVEAPSSNVYPDPIPIYSENPRPAEQIVVRPFYQENDRPVSLAGKKEKVRKPVSQDDFKAFYLLRVNFLLIIINVVVFFVSEAITYRHPEINYIGALKVMDLYDPKYYYHFLTAAFAHFGMEHLAGNMSSLFFIGPTLEEVLGKWKYLMMYLISAVMANVLSVIIYTGMGRFNVITAGASGAVYAVMGGMIAAMICKRLEMRRTNTMVMIAVTGYMLVSGFFSKSGVNNSAHAVGLFFGFMICFLIFVIQDQFRKQKRKKRGFN
ncbi:MAG: rhomboid family intramembrane serine protease [Lachnospiraceae bacterium]|nr:rhomboid family intramembrane serine protease [Lachnospiraceae bacterium]